MPHRPRPRFSRAERLATAWLVALLLHATPAGAQMIDAIGPPSSGTESQSPRNDEKERATVASPQPSAPEETAETRPSPDDRCAGLGWTAALARQWPGTCGTDKPPHGAMGGLAGLWDVEVPANPHSIEALRIALHYGSDGLGMHSPAEPLRARAYMRFPKRGYVGAPSAPPTTAEINETGELVLRFGGFDLCACVQYELRVSPQGASNRMVGEWSFDGKRGTTLWRRRPPARIRTVEYLSSQLVQDRVAVGVRPLRIVGRHPVTCGNGMMRGNCGGVWIIVRGENFEGLRNVWLDPATHMEIRPYNSGWICGSGENESWIGHWTRCAGAGGPGDGVTGIYLRVLLWDGVVPGPRTLWIDGTPIPIEMVIEGFPEAELSPKPDLRRLVAVNASGEPIEAVREGEPFRVRAIFSAAHPDPWIGVALPGIDGRYDQRGEERQVILRRTERPDTFESGWLAVEPAPPID